MDDDKKLVVMVDDHCTGLALGAVDYITKPYEPSLLLQRIETTIGG